MVRDCFHQKPPIVACKEKGAGFSIRDLWKDQLSCMHILACGKNVRRTDIDSEDKLPNIKFPNNCSGPSEY